MKPQPLITVRSVNDSAHFYCNLLGAQRGHAGDNYAQILLSGEMILQLHDFAGDDDHDPLGNESVPLGNGVVLWFETGDLPALLSRIAQHGIELDAEPAENPYAMQMECWLHDPDGYRIVIAGSSPHPRAPIDTSST